jgi:hypothetical protein
MKLSDAIKRVDRSDRNTSCANIEDFARLFDINVYDSDEFSDRVKHHWLAPWFCSDDVVGMSVYYMDNEPIAVQMRKARKSDKNIEFVSEAAANKVRDFIMQIKAKQGDVVPIVKNLDQDIGDDYSVAYGDQLLVKKATYHGQAVEIVTTWRWSDHIDKTQRAMIKYENGATEEVDVDDLRLTFRLTPEE